MQNISISLGPAVDSIIHYKHMLHTKRISINMIGVLKSVGGLVLYGGGEVGLRRGLPTSSGISEQFLLIITEKNMMQTETNSSRGWDPLCSLIKWDECT